MAGRIRRLVDRRASWRHYRLWSGRAGEAKESVIQRRSFRATVHPPVNGQHKQGPPLSAPRLGRRGTDRDPRSPQPPETNRSNRRPVRHPVGRSSCGSIAADRAEDRLHDRLVIGVGRPRIGCSAGGPRGVVVLGRRPDVVPECLESRRFCEQDCRQSRPVRHRSRRAATARLLPWDRVSRQGPGTAFPAATTAPRSAPAGEARRCGPAIASVARDTAQRCGCDQACCVASGGPLRASLVMRLASPRDPMVVRPARSEQAGTFSSFEPDAAWR